VKKNGKSERGRPSRRPRTLIVAVCALALFGTILYGGARIGPGIGKKIDTSSYFRLEGVDVIGVERADRDEIGRAIGFAEGSPVLETDLVAIRDRVKSIDWVRDVKVRRDLPNRLIITVVEHTPVAVAMTDEGVRFVDPDGETARIGTDAGGLPMFVGMTKSTEYAEAARLLKDLSTRRLVADGGVKSVRFDPVMGYTVFTREGIEIRFGQPPFDGKLGRLAQVLGDAQRRGPIRYVYLNIDDRVIVRVGAPLM
jgi:cell division septal protein FtsQ